MYAGVYWSRLENGDLLHAAESAGFQVMITCDRNLRYQQNLANRSLAIVEITTNNWLFIEPHGDRNAMAVAKSSPGGYIVIEITPPPKPDWIRER